MVKIAYQCSFCPYVDYSDERIVMHEKVCKNKPHSKGGRRW